MKDRVDIKVWSKRGSKGETLDLYFSNLEDANSFSRFWATVEGEEVTEERSCRFKVLTNYAGGIHPPTYIKPLSIQRNCRCLDGSF